MSELPDPLTPPDCDLRNTTWMPFFGTRVFGSSFWSLARRNNRAGLAGIKLWWEAWMQCPAASLPDDDFDLAELAGFGDDVRAWQAVRESALHGFIKCSDGRLYHALLAKEAIRAHEAQLMTRTKRERERERVRSFREAKKAESGPEPAEKRAAAPEKPRPSARKAAPKPAAPPTQAAAPAPAVDEVAEAISAYMEAAHQYRLPLVILPLAQARRSKLVARLRQVGGIEGWRRAMGEIAVSAFLRGEKTDFRADLDFFLQETSMTRLLEGRYRDREDALSAMSPHQRTKAIIASIEADDDFPVFEDVRQ